MIAKQLLTFMTEFPRPDRGSLKVWSVCAFEQKGRFFAVAETEDGMDGRLVWKVEALSEETALSRLRDQLDASLGEVMESR